METTTKSTYTLENLRSQAYNAHRWTSFDPEKRAESIVKDYSEELDSDLQTIGNDSQYKERYINHLTTWLSAKSRCASSMITGPANFNVAKHEKANRSEHNKYQEFREWRERALKAIEKAKQPEKTFSTELEAAKTKLKSLEDNRFLEKEANKKIKEALKNMYNIDEYLLGLGVKPHMLEHTMRWGFGSCNTNANIRNAKQRVAELEAKEAKQVSGNKEISFDGGKVIFNYEIDRIQIKHDVKPEPEVITKLKQNAFKWSPSQQVWQRQLTQNAIYSTQYLLGIKL